ncbi:secreted protein-like protein [Dinothrombium tinctorium]|uniref:Secreted protein-like protein n=1 Tax=Dinothrombium tinctorium TaxID=1965070 RepID=A0A443R7M6_9ACAR|nr:secreted protein-like protein [Dinothrombium tinctorium]RWS11275.1 secreted protein-like protein [Dinothrombium tinctorium]
MFRIYIIVAIFALNFHAFISAENSIRTSASETGDVQELVIDGSVILQCNLTDGQSTLTNVVESWFKDGELITEPNDHYSIEKDKNTLTIAKGRRTKDEGNFTCSIGDLNATITLIAKPLIHKFSPIDKGTRDGKSVNVVEESRLVLECVANSTDTPEFSWLRKRSNSSNNDDLISEPARGNISISDDYLSSNLTIESVTLEDRAIYICRVKNRVGSVELEMLVRVKAIQIDNITININSLRVRVIVNLKKCETS